MEYIFYSEYHENLFNNDFFCAVEETKSLHIQVDDHVSTHILYMIYTYVGDVSWWQI